MFEDGSNESSFLCLRRLFFLSRFSFLDIESDEDVFDDKSDNDDDDIEDMAQTLIWIGFNTVASREALQIDIEQFEDMLDLTKKDISDLEYSY